ncbi:MAG TPA: sensor histidine kinase [Ktedonobacteraceae bacterium]
MNTIKQKSLLRWFLLVWLSLIYIQSLQSQGLFAFIQGSGPATQIVPGVEISSQFVLIVSAILMLVHSGLHWLAPSLKKSRELLLYFLGQGLLVLCISIIVRTNNVAFYLCLALTIEAVILLKPTRFILPVVGGYFLLFVLLEGVQIAHFLLDGSASSMSKASNTVATSLMLVLFVIACMILYIQQRQEHQQDQALLSELETAHAELKMTHNQLEITHSQLEEYAARVEDLTLMTERQRLARELHDTLSQGLVGLTMQLETIDALLLKQDTQQARAIARQAMFRSRTTMTQARAAIEDLRAEPRDAHNFTQQVQSEIQRFTSATGIVCTCSLPETFVLSTALHEPFLRLISEGLMNVARHAQAMRAWVCGTCEQDMMTLEIGDDGIGFDPLSVAQQAGHYGLLGLRERARLLQGQLAIVSAPGQGTTLRLHLPLGKRGICHE